jgi:hypothetical protein
VIYVITNLIHTSGDQHRRGHRLREFRKGRVQIGPRSIDEGRSASFSEEMYNQYKERIDHYQQIGMIKVVSFGGPDPVIPAEDPVILQETVSVVEAASASVEPAQEAAAPESVSEPAEIPAPEKSDSVDPEEEVPAAPAAKRRGRPPKEK